MGDIIKNILSIIFPPPIVENFWGTKENDFNDESRCDELNIIYPNIANVSSLNIEKNGPDNVTQYTNNRKTIKEIPKKIKNHPLRDFYVKTSYNCAAVGEFKKGYVDICAIKNGIKQGCRCLDFEIYSIDNKPVIATSSSKTNYIKESHNHLPFHRALKVIAENAFNTPSPCPFDPLVIHLRIKSENKKIFNHMARQIENNLGKRLLPKRYGREFKDKNLGDVAIKHLMGKVIICVDKENSIFEDTNLDKYVNVSSNSMFMRLHRNYDVKYIQDFKELIDYNKTAMSMVIPDVGSETTNSNPNIPLKYGCQYVAMNLQNNDDSMQYYTKFFNDYGSSFVLKDKKLRKQDKTVPLPPLQDEKLSYRDREIKDQHYTFRI